jgi:hypothetical protein
MKEFMVIGGVFRMMVPMNGEMCVDLEAMTLELHKKEAALEHLSVEVRDLRIAVQVAEKYAFRVSSLSIANTASRPSEKTPASCEAMSSIRKMSHAEIAEKAFLEAGRPLRAKDVVDYMIAVGHTTRDRKKLQNMVFTTLGRRKDLFRRLTPGTWELGKTPALDNSGGQ